MPKPIIEPKTTNWCHTHTFESNKCMHVIHSDGFRFNGILVVLGIRTLQSKMEHAGYFVVWSAGRGAQDHVTTSALLGGTWPHLRGHQHGNTLEIWSLQIS